MIIAGDEPHEDDRVFWIGNTALEVAAYGRRRMGGWVAIKHPDMFDFRTIRWKFGPDQHLTTPEYVTLPYHCRYRVLIDFGGVGFSARIPLLLASGRPLILVGHPEEAWFYWDGTLVPWEHYIPCGPKDGSELNENMIFESIEWTFKNPEEARKIGMRGRRYALNNLTRQAALARIVEMMSKHSHE